METRATRRGQWHGAVCATAAFLSACTRGGQSGTEGSDLIVCLDTETRAVAPDEVLPFLNHSPNELAALAAHNVPGLWLSTGTRSELSVTFSSQAVLRQRSKVAGRAICSSELEIDPVTVRSSDGAIDAQVPGHLTLIRDYHEETAVLWATLPELPERYTGPAVWPPDVRAAQQWLETHWLKLFAEDRELELGVEFQLGTSPLRVDASILQDGHALGIWSVDETSLPSGPPRPYTPDALLARACTGAEQWTISDFSPFPSAAAATAGMVGTWARCLDNSPSSHAGLQILPDGTWRDFTLEAGELVGRSGFEHEGFLEAREAGSISETPELFQINLLPFGRNYDSDRFADGSTHASNRALVFASGTDGWPAAVYLPTPLPVRAATVGYADGERAGAAACASGEQGIVSGLEESVALTSGDFVLCTGALPGGVAQLHFEPAQVELRRADGSVISSGGYRIETMNAPSFTISVGDWPYSRSWHIAVSRRPRKLWIEEADWLTVKSHTAVFSALP